MILFKKVRWCNFLSTGNLFTEINLDQNKTTLIVGENGAGKSTILDAISFALFNKPFRKINKPQLVNTITGKDLRVEIEFDIGRDSYEIHRGIKPNVFQVFINGVLLNQDAATRDYQEVLETAILRMNHKTFCQVVVLGSASYVPFMQLPAAQRREIIEDLLDLNIFTEMNSLLKDKVSVNTQEIKDVDYNKTLTQTKIQMIEEHLESMNDSAENRLADLLADLKTTKEELAQLVFEKETTLSERDDLQNELKKVTGLEKKKVKLDKFIIQYQTKLDALSDSKDFFAEHTNCPTCEQDISEDHKNQIIQANSDRGIEYKNALNVANSELVEVIKTLKKFNKTKESIQDINIKLSQLDVKIQNSEYNIERMDKAVQKTTEEKNQLDASKIVELEAELSELETKYTTLHEDKNVLAAASLILKDGGIKSKIIKQYVPIINKLINKYLSAMDFFVQFELNEQFEEHIKSRFRDDFSYASFSEGEKMRINLAVLFTWRSVSKQRNSVSTNLLIMDEVFDSSLDANGTEEFIKILNGLTQDTNTFIISHRTGQLYDKFEKILTFKKVANFSKVE